MDDDMNDMDDLNIVIEESEPEPIRTTLFEERDYREQDWKIAIHPPDRNFSDDSFFWRLTRSVTNGLCHLLLLPGWDPSRDIARDHSFSMTTSRSDTCRRSSHRSSWTRKLPLTRPLNWTPSARLARSGRD
ncbi:hypothetical protein BC936DRAFT_136885 [Jimgerdemannia flammicorona]|uniref:Uncharacterized protein n=1 Tax=Jimgerdemannia flammicorona TaxID=994334 RepID=A0A433CYL7_9FUNG|nr:hypothetical protein BC936DRAFT_136885 [Jimgerdemannia flammicorona]